MSNWTTTLFGNSAKFVSPKASSTAAIKTEDLAKYDIVGLYFSAHWCGPCRGFTPTLSQNYELAKFDGSGAPSFEIVFISSDQDRMSFSEYHAEMPFPALDFDCRDVKSMLSKKFAVRGIPTLLFLNGKTGELITSRGRGLVDMHGGKFVQKIPLPSGGSVNPITNTTEGGSSTSTPTGMTCPKISRSKSETMVVVGQGEWKSQRYLSVPANDIQSIEGFFFASDHQYGATGSACVRLTLRSQNGDLKSEHKLSVVNAERKRYAFRVDATSWKELGSAVGPGDTVDLEAVSPPWEGWSCKMYAAAMHGQLPCFVGDGGGRDGEMGASAAAHVTSESSSAICRYVSRSKDTECTVVGNGEWRCASYLTVPAMGLKSIEGSVLASDQGHGGSGSSYIRLALRSSDGTLKSEHKLQIVDHSKKQYAFSVDARTWKVIGSDVARPGDTIDLQAVSAPWPAWSCKIFKASMNAKICE